LELPHNIHRTWLGILSGLGAAAIWGAMYVVSKVVLDVIPPFALITLRLLLGALTLGVVLAIRGWPRISRSQFWQLLGVGFIGYAVSLGLQFVGTRLSTAANSSLVTSATPAFVLFFAWIILGEHITLRRLTALLVSTAGVVAVINPAGASLDPALFWGNVSLFGAGLTWALYSVLVRKVSGTIAILPLSTFAFLGGLPASIPLGAWELSSQGLGEITWGIVAGVLFLGVVCSGLAMLLWNLALAVLDASLASLTFFAQPVVGTALAVIFLGETLSPLFILGGLMIGSGIWIAARSS